MARKNPYRKGKLVKVPKGKRKSQIFTHKGLRYIVISRLVKRRGKPAKRVRYAQRVSADYGKKVVRKRTATKKRKTSKRKNPYAGGRCKDPSKRNMRSGFRFSASGRSCVVQRTRNSNTYIAMAQTKAKKKPTITIPKGKKKGDHFKKGSKHYVVVSYVKNGKRVRFARTIKAPRKTKKSRR